MSQEFFELIQQWDGNGVVTSYDAETGAWIFIALHDARLGRPTGGTRMKVYPKVTDGLVDAMRLAEGMTYKWAGIRMATGGAKAVIALDHPVEGDEREGLLLRYGDLVDSLAGAFATGADLGTGAQAMEVIGRRTPYVIGVNPDGSSTDPGPYTARGVYVGILAALQTVFGEASPEGRKILVEGLGGVGLPLLRALHQEGARLLLADLDEEKAASLAHELGAEAVALADVPETECDVYAPCAVGATVNPDTVPRLKCRIVAGSANNQLLSDADAEALHERGILYVPDYIINAGGALALTLLREGRSSASSFERVGMIRETVAEILADATDANESPIHAARRHAVRVLAEAGTQ